MAISSSFNQDKKNHISTSKKIKNHNKQRSRRIGISHPIHHHSGTKVLNLLLFLSSFLLMVIGDLDPSELSVVKDMTCIQLFGKTLKSIFGCPSRTQEDDVYLSDNNNNHGNRYPNNELHPDPSSSKSFLSSCIFCRIAHGNASETERIVFEDEHFIAFNDIRPSALVHVLVIPKQHIADVFSLKSVDTILLEEMKEIGKKILTARSIPIHNRQLGFHVPPFTSVPHLHLHVLGLPFRNWLRGLKYPDYWKGCRWWVGLDRILFSLKNKTQLLSLENGHGGRNISEPTWRWSWMSS